MSDQSETCKKCSSPYSYQDGLLWICPECAHEWSIHSEEIKPDLNIIRDVNGNELKDGDTVTVIKDLKVKGASSSVKVGTKVKNIKLVLDSPDGHDINCKINGFGQMGLKSEFVKKA